MPAPRMFISSTYFDLRHVRADLEAFGRHLGFDMVLFEHGSVPYAEAETLEESCLREVATCDLVVAIIGGRVGSRSRATDGSISQAEVRRAHELGKQLYFFVEAGVNTEYGTYLDNEARAEEIHWSTVDSVAVFHFIKEVRTLERNNAVFPFVTSQDIVTILREQLAGLFQTLLQRRSRGRYESNVTNLINAVRTVQDIVDFLKQRQANDEEEIRRVLFTHHPLFQRLREILAIRFRVFFEDLAELESLLAFLGFAALPSKELEAEARKRYSFWYRRAEFLGLARELFDAEGRLRPLGLDAWREDLIVTSPHLAE